MAQRISRAKRRIAGLPLDQRGDPGTVLRVLDLVFSEGYSGNVDLVAEAIRLTRQLVQIVEWHDELLLLTGSPVVRLNRAVPVGEADGPQAGLAALADLSPDLPRLRRGDGLPARTRPSP